MNRTWTVSIVLAGLLLGLLAGDVSACTTIAAGQVAQTPSQTAPAQAGQAAKPPAQTTQKPANQAKPARQKPPAPIVPAPPVAPPPGYVIGPDDVLQVMYWREKDVSAEVTVRPDGMISLPLLNDVQAAGLTPDQLRDKVNQLATKFFEDPNVTVNIKAINSRKVFITGSVTKPGPYPLTSPTTVLQLIAMAGGLTEFADQKNITVMRTENGRPVSYAFNYKDVTKRKNLQQNIELKPGDTVIVP